MSSVEALLKDGLYFEMARHANEMAARLQNGLRAKGWTLWVDSPPTRCSRGGQRPQAPARRGVRLRGLVPPTTERHTVVRFVTCFQTSQEDVDGLLASLPDLH